MLIFLLLRGGALLAGAQGLPAPDLRQVVQVEFQTVAGAAYWIEGSADGQTWSEAAGPIFGDGAVAKTTVPAAAGTPWQWRVKPVPESTLLPGTGKFAAQTITLNDHGRARQMIFFPVIQGVQRGVLKTDALHSRSFLWKAQRKSKTETAVRLEFRDGTASCVDLTFSNSKLGSYQLRDKDVSGVVQVMESGAFSLHQGRIRDEPGEALLPLLLAGQQWITEEGGVLTRLDFGTDGNVTLNRADGTTERQPYRYSRNVNPSAGEVQIGPPDGPAQSYQFQMSTEATGGFNRIPLPLPGFPLMPGLLPQRGTVNIPTSPVVTSSTTGAPSSLSGKTLQLDGEDPVTLTFHSDGTGTATREEDGSVEVTPFTYSYSPTDDDEASLALTYPGADSDRVEDYDLDFSSQSGGSYRSSAYEGGEFARSTSGSFNGAGS